MSSENDKGPGGGSGPSNPLAPGGKPMSEKQKDAFDNELSGFLDNPDGYYGGGTKDIMTGKGTVSAATVPDQSTSDALANALNDRWESGFGQVQPFNTPLGPIQTPIGGMLNALGNLSNKNIQNQLKNGGIPVYGNGDKISIGYDPNADIKDLKGVMGTGLFGGTAYSGQPMFNPNQFDNKGNRLPQEDKGGDDNQTSTLGNAVAAKPIIKKPTEYAKANNVNPQQQNVKVRKPKAAGDGDEVDGALVRRTKTLQSNRRGILGRPDSKKKTLLGA